MLDSERYLTKQQAAKHFKVSPQLISRKFRQGKLTMVNGMVDVVESIGAFGGWGRPVRTLETPVSAAATPGEALEPFADAQRRKETALANLRELEHRQKSGDLVEVAEMERVWAEAGQAFRDGLLAIPEKIAPVLASLTDARQVRDELKRELRQVLENLPETIQALAIRDTKAA